jgi:DNA-binding MarR family transcriptional regulator
MTEHPIDFSLCRECACSAARRTSRELTRAFDEAMRETGVRGTQFNLLATLILAGPTAATRLAALLGLERTTLTRNLRPLLRDSLVRFDGDRDRRVRKIAITAKGEETARAAFPFWKRAQDAAQSRVAGLATHSA